MTAEAHDPELDPSLEQWLAEASAHDAAAPEGLDELLAQVEEDIGAAEKKRSFWIKTRPTWARRAVACAAAALVVLVGGALTLRDDFAAYPSAYMAVALGSLAALLALSVHQALRPLHQPPMSLGARAAVVGATLGATCLLAVLSPHDASEGAMSGLLTHVSPCLFYGLLMGVPVFFLLRLMDRGGMANALIAACAAGVAGNLTLQLHCPRNEPEHLMLAHFGVVLLFVAGLGGAQLLARTLRR